ncbi:Pimeloyl-ACP methyl ester carboxylesterase [Actinacidiphila alni]|uniref:Pimeloyl-ACP methyl ester carboxylesterase n=1 Tax=Actinacidiphila alni TaxID=380248 RepID=A0A1I2FZJ2_9ACTN|nr:alpha/beta hydrolase [Actinacidiphila alni]SFF10227.1 Pimeloyl-ACP methyl ester carboxylesterase [Actinacidiphila alni]
MTVPYEAVRPRRELSVVSADGTRIHVEEYGRADGPPIVLSHGWTCSTLFWAPVVRRLAADFRVIAYDQRGHGRSTYPAARSSYGTRQLADDLEAVLTAVLPGGGGPYGGEKAVLVGHSMGGMTIMAASGRAAVSDRTAAVLLASTGSGRLLGSTRVLPPRFSSRRVRRAVHRQLLVSRLPLGPVTPLSRAALKYGVMAPGSTRDQAAFTARVVHACRSRQRSEWGRVLAVLDLDAELAALTAPTTVLVGTADKLTPPVHAHGMAAALPDCVDLIELPGLGHMTPIEDAAAVEAAVRSLAATYQAAAGASEEGAGVSEEAARTDIRMDIRTEEKSA